MAVGASIALIVGQAGLVVAHASGRPASGARSSLPANNVTLCHATASTANPYVAITVDANSSGGQQQLFGNNGHAGHTGTPAGYLFDPDTSKNGDDWGDIIPGFDYHGTDDQTHHFDGLNWSSEGQGIYAGGGCTGIPAPDVSIDKQGPSSAGDGDSFTYTLSVSNTGTADATDVHVVDPVPAGMTVTAVTPSQGSCTGLQSFDCDLGTLADGQGATVTVEGTVTPEACGGVTNTATASAGNEPTGSVGSDNSDSVTTEVDCPAVELSVDVQKRNDANLDGDFHASETAAAGGADVPFEVTITNTSAVDVAIDRITDMIGEDPSEVCGTLVGTTLAANGGLATCTFTLASYAPDPNEASKVDTVTVDVSDGEEHTAQGQGSSTVDPPREVPELSVAVDKTNDADGDGTFTATEEAALAGQDVAFHLEITNTSDVAVVVDAIDDDQTTNAICGDLIGSTLQPDRTVTCDYTLTDYAPSPGSDRTNLVTVPVHEQGYPANEGSGQGSSTVTVSDEKVTICHRTDSDANPYVKQDVPPSALDGEGDNDHTLHTGPVWPATGPDGRWGDIVPPFGDHPGLNWDADGQALYEDSCEPSPELSVTKSGSGSVSNGPNGAGIQYQITVTNIGTADAKGVSLEDQVDAVVTRLQASADSGSCQVSDHTVICDLGTIERGDSVTVTVTGTVSAGACPTFTNQASAAIDGIEAAFQSNVVTTSVTGCGSALPRLTITKEADDASVAAGERIGFTITVSSAGTVTATSVTLTDALPSGLGIAWAIDGGTGADRCTIEGSTLSCAFEDMAAGSSYSVHIGSDTASNLCGTVSNSASAGASNVSPVTDSDAVRLSCGVSTHPGIRIEKDGPAVAHVGDTVTYTFVVTNTGDVPLVNVAISDPVCDPGTVSGPTGDAQGDGVLSPGEDWGFSCTHVVTEEDHDPLPNTATVCSDGPSGIDVCDSDGHVVDLIHPSIDVVKKASPKSGEPGDRIAYTYTVRNTGDVPLTDISVDDDILGHVCDVPQLKPGDSAVCTALYRIPKDSPLHIRNVAVAAGSDPTGEQVQAEDSATIAVVAGATVTRPPTHKPPASLAFTGSSSEVPFGVLALVLLMIGSCLTWAGRRRARRAED